MFTSSASILKHSKKQKKELENLKSILLSTLYPVSSEIMEMPSDIDKPLFSSRSIENFSRKRKAAEERKMSEKQIKEMCPSLEEKVSKKEEKEIQPTDPTKNAKKALYEALLTVASFPFSGVKKVETRWLQMVGVLTRIAKKKFQVFKSYKAGNITHESMGESIEFQVVGEMNEIPLCFKDKK